MYLANYGRYRLEKKICNCNVAIANRYRQLPKIFEIGAMFKLGFYFRRRLFGFLICPYRCDHHREIRPTGIPPVAGTGVREVVEMRFDSSHRVRLEGKRI